MRHAAKVDSNAPAIVKALERVGCLVWCIGTPFDLLVRYGRAWHILEVKNRDGKNRLTDLQKDDLAMLERTEGNRDAVKIVYDEKEALTAVGFFVR